MLIFFVLLFLASFAAIIYAVRLYLNEEKRSRELSSQLQDYLNGSELKEEPEKVTSPKMQESIQALRQDVTHLIDQTKLKDIMTRKVISINIDAPFSQVYALMNEHEVRHLPVVDSQNRLVGLMTQRLMYKVRSPRKLMDGEWFYDKEMLDDVILKHVMINQVYTLNPDQTLGKALMKMVYSRYGSIPIVEKDQTLVGIVTRRDILKVVADFYSQTE